MKYIKLLLIFLIVAGGTFLALNWGNLFSSSSMDDDFQKDDGVDIEAMSEEIRSAWAEQLGWNQVLYKEWRENIELYKENKLFSRVGYNTVNNALRESAANAVQRGYLSALKPDGYTDATVRSRFQDVETLKDLEQLAEDSRIKDVETLHAQYLEVYTFAITNRSHIVTPKLKDGADWTSFSSNKNWVLRQASNLKGNQWYKKVLYQVPGFEEGLDESFLTQILDDQKSGYYSKLYGLLLNYFNSLDPKNPLALNLVYKEFTRQIDERPYISNGESLKEKLADFYVDYKEKAEEEEAARKAAEEADTQ